MNVNKNYVIKVFKKLLLPIIVFSLLLASACLPLYNQFSPKYYSAQSQFIVEPKKETNVPYLSNTDISKQVNNYSIFAYGELLLDKVREEFGDKYTAKELKSFLTVKSSSDSQIVTIQITTNNKKDSIAIANLFLDNMLKEAPKYFVDNNLRTLSKAKSSEKIVEMTKKTWFIISSISFYLFLQLLVAMLFMFNNRLFFDWQVIMLTGVEKVYSI
ncbi:YveK family protein [Enterococcus faecalis]|uniref:YveK family protein n=1 Tax=Enterococcus faecalis TaxID=1351 RepID=UPI002DBE011B|nr:hypothetical protein [Enterococcus faecalis]MEB8146407.1 hypothetical protein [Enterococcus faecalis]